MTIRRPRIAMDMDTMLDDDQWNKLQKYLSDYLDDDQMHAVETICRGGGDAPEQKGASDAARSVHRSRPITHPTSVSYDAKSFPNARRLK